MANEVTTQSIWNDYQKGITFKNQIGLFETVQKNENFYNDRQWEDVSANGAPTPQDNFICRIISFRIASIVSDNIKINASPLSSTSPYSTVDIETLTNILNRQFESILERNKFGKLVREYVRDAAVDGDGCMYAYFDPDIETGQTEQGDIVIEMLENTRVIFGNPNDRRVEKQPWVIIPRRMFIDDVKRMVEENGGNPDQVKPDSDDTNDKHDGYTDDKVTVLLKFWREYYKEGDITKSRIMACEATQNVMIREPWDTEQKLYPITWFSMKNIKNCYHGQADVTGLIPAQIFVNKLMALTQIAMTSMAYPRIVYDGTRISGDWDNRVGAAIKINGGDMNSVAKVLEGASMQPQVTQIPEYYIARMKDDMGATDAALGNAAVYNTSALISQQRATQVPLEMSKQDAHQSIEDLGRILIDLMATYYGKRSVELKNKTSEQMEPVEFDFATLKKIPISLKLDVGASAYWSEITSVNTLENLLNISKAINPVQFLERLPAGQIPKQQELIDELKRLDAVKANLAALMTDPEVQPPMPPGTPPNGTGGGTASPNQSLEIPIGRGYSQLQRAINASDAPQ